MPVYEFKCPLCNERVEDFADMAGMPCANRTCSGVLTRAYSFYLKPVAGGGGSPGRRVSQ